MALLPRPCLSMIIFLITFCACAPTLEAQLDYGTFEGSYSARYNLSYWQKIPFAAPPVGQNRFRGPQPPVPVNNGTYNSTQPFDMCPQRTVNGSEDCLYLGLYSRPWTKAQPLRPVVVVFYGGGFIQGSAYFSVPPPGAYVILSKTFKVSVHTMMHDHKEIVEIACFCCKYIRRSSTC